MRDLNKKTKQAKRKLTAAFWGCLILYLAAVAAVIVLVILGITR